ncbi:portal protein [Pseudomonas phage vB_Pae_CF81b]|nr:portal protein [Pseudomonas phage vB_Pae_CF81b]
MQELTFEINDLFAHLMRIGVVPLKAEFTAIWDDLTVARREIWRGFAQ